MGEVNWLLSIGGAIILSIIANLLTPPIQKWRDQRALSTRGKKLKKLKEEYEQVKGLHDDFLTLYVRTARFNSGMQIILFLFLTGILTILIFSLNVPPIALITAYLLLITLLYFASRFTKHTDDLIRLSKFEQYEADVQNRIRELEEGLENDGDSG